MKMHPQTRAFLDDYNAAAQHIDYQRVSAADVRRMFAIPSPTAVIDQRLSIADAVIDGPVEPIAVRTYSMKDKSFLPITLFFHGGGFVIGDLGTADGLCRSLAITSGTLVVSVDYRRAPEARFPAGLDDCWAALLWARQHGRELGGDPGRIAVAGNSSGANFAALIAQRAHAAAIPLSHQLLLFPVIDPRMDRPSFRAFDTGYLLTASMMRWFWRQYLPRGEDDADPGVSPLATASLEGIAPATVFTAEADILRDEGEEYAHAMRRAGVPVLLERWVGQIHDFTLLEGAVDDASLALKEAGRALAAGSSGR